MENIIFTILVMIFLFVNFQIIRSDQKIKKIPNKNLLELISLLPFWYIFLYYFGEREIHILNLSLQVVLSLLVSFFLYNLGIWRAGDAKYLLVLSLFIPYIGIITFIWNLGLLTLFYLFWYFLWFFIWRSIFERWYAKNLYQNIKTDLSRKWEFYKTRKWGNGWMVILKWASVFLIIFVSVRLVRIYIFAKILENTSQNVTLLEIFQKYHYYSIFIGIIISLGIYYFSRKFLWFFMSKISQKYTKHKYFGIIFWWIILTILLFFISYEYNIDAKATKIYLIRIFTIYIALYIIIKIIWYGYKTSFIGSQKVEIPLHLLQKNHIIDKQWLDDVFHFRHDNGEEWFRKMYNNAITKESIHVPELKKLIRAQNNYDKKYKKYSKDEPLRTVIIIKTFSFGIYIFLSFIVTYLFWTLPINVLSQKILELIQF